MEFKEAYETIVARSVQKNTIEIPTILSCLDFEGAECLEIGAGPQARIAIKLAGFAKHITCLEKDADNVSKIGGEAGYHDVEKKISALYYKYEKGEKERRMQYRGQITRFLIAKGFKVDENYRERLLGMAFTSSKEIRETYYCLAFKNSLSDKDRKKVDRFLDRRIRSYQRGFYMIHGIRI